MSVRPFRTSELLQSKNVNHRRNSKKNNPKEKCFAIWRSAHPVHIGWWKKQGNGTYPVAVTFFNKVCCLWRKQEQRSAVNLSGYTRLSIEVSFYCASFFTGGHIFISHVLILPNSIFYEFVAQFIVTSLVAFSVFITAF